MTSTKWQKERYLIFPPLEDALKKFTHGIIFPEKSPETNCETPTYWVTEKIPVWKQVGKETYSCRKPRPRHSTLWLERNPQLQLFPEEQRVWTTHLVSQLPGLPPEGLVSKTLSSESCWGSALMSPLGS